MFKNQTPQTISEDWPFEINIFLTSLLPAACTFRQNLCCGLDQDHLHSPCNMSLAHKSLTFIAYFSPCSEIWCRWRMWLQAGKLSCPGWAGMHKSNTFPMCSEGAHDMKILATGRAMRHLEELYTGPPQWHSKQHTQYIENLLLQLVEEKKSESFWAGGRHWFLSVGWRKWAVLLGVFLKDRNMANNFFLYGLSLPGLTTCLLYKCPMLWCQVSLYKEWSFAWCHHASPSWFCDRGEGNTGGKGVKQRTWVCVA